MALYILQVNVINEKFPSRQSASENLRLSDPVLIFTTRFLKCYEDGIEHTLTALEPFERCWINWNRTWFPQSSLFSWLVMAMKSSNFFYHYVLRLLHLKRLIILDKKKINYSDETPDQH